MEADFLKTSRYEAVLNILPVWTRHIHESPGSKISRGKGEQHGQPQLSQQQLNQKVEHVEIVF